jgi:hypothetical protein
MPVKLPPHWTVVVPPPELVAFAVEVVVVLPEVDDDPADADADANAEEEPLAVAVAEELPHVHVHAIASPPLNARTSKRGNAKLFRTLMIAEDGCAAAGHWPQYWPQTQKYSAILASLRCTGDLRKSPKIRTQRHATILDVRSLGRRQAGHTQSRWRLNRPSGTRKTWSSDTLHVARYCGTIARCS